jgi:hypothetical protein
MNLAAILNPKEIPIKMISKPQKLKIRKKRVVNCKVCGKKNTNTKTCDHVCKNCKEYGHCSEKCLAFSQDILNKMNKIEISVKKGQEDSTFKNFINIELPKISQMFPEIDEHKKLRVKVLINNINN